MPYLLLLLLRKGNAKILPIYGVAHGPAIRVQQTAHHVSGLAHRTVLLALVSIPLLPSRRV